MNTSILPTDTPDRFQAAVRRAADLLRKGEVVALPTETVYGLAANALDPHAVTRIFHIKNRPSNNPIIVHVADINMARACVAEWPPAAEKLAASFWPGPLTLVLQRSAIIPNIVTAGGNTVGIRWPNHPFAQAVIRECGFPLAAPSANLSNRISPTTPNHVQLQLGGRLPLIVDGGPCQVGIESTVLDLTASPARVLRPGMILQSAITVVLGPQEIPDPELPQSEANEALRSPGLLQKHYAPNARLAILSWSDDTDLAGKISDLNYALSNVCLVVHSRIPAPENFRAVNVLPRNPEAFARALYTALHHCDQLAVGLIVVEAPPETDEWAAIRNRLSKAAGGEMTG